MGRVDRLLFTEGGYAPDR